MATMEKVIIDYDADIKKLEENQKKIINDLKKMDKQSKKSTGNMSKDFEKTSKKTSKLKDSVSGLYTQLLAGALAFKKLFDATKNNITAQALLRNNVEKTANATGRSMSFFKKLGKELSAYTGKTSADVNKMMSVASNYTNIATKNMKGFLTISADASVAWGQDVQSSIAMIGETLNNPQTFSRLEALGVKMSVADEKMITHLIKIGDTAKAQAIIIGELQSRFGGASEKLNNTMIGNIETAMNQITDVMAEIGKTIIPVISDILSVVGSIASAFTELPSGIQAIGIAFAGILPIVLHFMAASTAAAAAAGTAATFALGPIGLIIAAVAGLTGIIGFFSAITTSTADLVKANNEVSKSYKELKKDEEKLSKNDTMLKRLKNLEVGSKDYKKTLKEIMVLNPKLQKSNINLASSYKDVENSLNRLTAQQRLSLLLKRKKLEADALDALQSRSLSVGIANFLARNKKKLDDDQLKTVAARMNAITNYYKIMYAKAKGSEIAQNAIMSRAKKEILVLGQAIGQVAQKTGGTFDETFRDMVKDIKGITADITSIPTLTTTSTESNLIGTTGQTKEQIEAGNKWARERAIEEADFLNKELLKLQHSYQDDKQALEDKYSKALANKQYKEAAKVWTEMDNLDIVHQKKKLKVYSDYDKKHGTETVKANQKATDTKISDTEKALNSANKLLQGDTEGFMQDMITQFGGQWGAVLNAGMQTAKLIFEIFKNNGDDFARDFENKLNKIKLVSSSKDSSTALMQSLGLLSTTGVSESSIASAKTEYDSTLGLAGGMSASDIIEIQQLLAESGFSNISDYRREAFLTRGDESLEALYSLLEDQGNNNKATFDALRGIDNLTEYVELLNTTLEKYQTALTEGSAFDIANLEHEYKMGNVTDEEYYASMDEFYYDLLKVMDENGATDQEIWAVQEAQYNLQQEANDLLAEGNDLLRGDGSAQLQSLMALKKEIETQISEGSIKNDTATQMYMQALMGQIIAQQNLEGFDSYAMREERAGLVSGYYGETFGGLSGSGIPVEIQQAQHPSVYNPVNNTTTNANVIQIDNQTFSGTIVADFLEQLETSYGINILQGA